MYHGNYLNLPIRTEAQARADISVKRQLHDAQLKGRKTPFVPTTCDGTAPTTVKESPRISPQPSSGDCL